MNSVHRCRAGLIQWLFGVQANNVEVRDSLKSDARVPKREPMWPCRDLASKGKSGACRRGGEDDIGPQEFLRLVLNSTISINAEERRGFPLPVPCESGLCGALFLSANLCVLCASALMGIGI